MALDAWGSECARRRSSSQGALLEEGPLIPVSDRVINAVRCGVAKPLPAQSIQCLLQPRTLNCGEVRERPTDRPARYSQHRQGFLGGGNVSGVIFEESVQPL